MASTGGRDTFKEIPKSHEGFSWVPVRNPVAIPIVPPASTLIPPPLLEPPFH